jgi:dipeptidyl aminopeptidase/acylaminoacyl peptidase
MGMKRLQPLDRIAIALMAVFTLLIVLLLLSGDRTVPQVRSFNWNHKEVGLENTAFTLEFNRAMNWEQVQGNLNIAPPLNGKVSWSGRRLAYTLTDPMPYGTEFQVQLAKVSEASRGSRHRPKIMQPFEGEFRSRDRAFVYLGVNGDEAGRLILRNLTQGKKTTLTPANLSVVDYRMYPLGDRILFAANDRNVQAQQDFNPQLYTVTTGLQIDAPDLPSTPTSDPGEVELVLDNEKYQILKFELSQDGKRIVVQRSLRQGEGLGAVDLWQLVDGSLKLLEGVTGGDFLIAPDSNTLVIAQGQGIALLPLDKQQTSEPLGFLPQFGVVLSFAQDGTAATMLKFNPDYSRSLFLVTNQGIQKELLKTKGSILRTVFGPQKQFVYCLLTQVQPGENYTETPYLAKIDLASGRLTQLLTLLPHDQTSISLAPDGSALLFDQVNTEGIQESSTLKLLPLNAVDQTPDLVAAGLNPRWLP